MSDTLAAVDGLSIEHTSFTPELAAELWAMPGLDAYLPVIRDHLDEHATATAGASVCLVARTPTAPANIAGLAYAHDISTGRRGWFLDIIVPALAAESVNITLRLLEAMRLHLPAVDFEWWVRGEHSVPARVVAESLKLPRLRHISRFELDLHGMRFDQGAPVRDFHGEDARAIAAINNSAFASHADRSAWSVTDVIDHLSKLGNHPEDLLLAPAEGEPVGFCWVKRSATDSAEIYVLAIHRQAQGNGLGKRLLTAGLRHIHDDLGKHRAFLYVDANNSTAIALYERAGFVDVHEALTSYRVPSARSARADSIADGEGDGSGSGGQEQLPQSRP